MRGIMGRWNRRGQGTLEYILLVTVIIAAIALAATTLIKPAVTKTMGSSATAINNAADQVASQLQ